MAGEFIYPVGTQVVSLKTVFGQSDKVAHPEGAVGVIVRSPVDQTHAYRVRFADGYEAALGHRQIETLANFKRENVGLGGQETVCSGLYSRVILRCVIGSRAYGLETEESDTDRRGVYLPTARQHWSLCGVPEQLENEETQEVYWELQKFITLALKANPNVLECLYSPLVEYKTGLGAELLSIRERFLSQLVFQTFSGYVASQFKKMQADIRNHGNVKWKHVMHLIRLLISGTNILNKAEVAVDVGEHRSVLLQIRSGEMPFEQADQLRSHWQNEFEAAFKVTPLPKRPDYERAGEFLVRAREAALSEQLP